MAQGTLFFEPIQRVFSNAGVVSPGAKAYFYLAGTTTPVNVFSDVGLTTAYVQPVVSDANGIFAEIFLTPGTAYKVDIQTSAGVSLTGYPADNQLAIPASSSTVSPTGTAGEAITAGQAVYLSDGSGSKNVGQWYKADTANAYSSILATEVGVAPASVASGAQGTFVTGGSISGLTVSPGSDYYVGSAGALTTIPGLNARLLGRADTASSIIIGAPPNIPLGLNTVCGRLTLTTLTPVTTTDVTAATTIYFTPYQGNLIWIFDGSRWLPITFAEVSLAVGTLVNAQAYDVFAFTTAGALTLEFAEWANAVNTMTIAAPGVVTWTAHGMATGNSITFTTTGALPTGLTANTQYFVTVVDANTFKLSTTLALVAAGTFITTSGTQSGVHTGHQPQARATALVQQNGVLVKTGATTRRYLGSFVTTTTTTTEDSLLKRDLFNYYNRVRRPLRVTDSTANWAYATAAYRQANGSTANQVEVMQGFAESVTDLYVAHNGGGPAGAGSEFRTSIGDGLANTADTSVTGGAGATVGGGAYSGSQLNGHMSKVLTAGWHRLLWLENSNGGASITWNSYGTSTNGLSGWCES